MHEKSCSWISFGSEWVNESQKLLKSAEKYFHPAEPSWVRKILFWSDLRFWDCLLTHVDCQLRCMSILIVTQRIYHRQLKCNYLKNQKLLSILNCIFKTYIIVKSPKIFAPQKVPKNFEFSFLSFDK